MTYLKFVFFMAYFLLIYLIKLYSGEKMLIKSLKKNFLFILIFTFVSNVSFADEGETSNNDINDNNSLSIEEIIVTAEKRSESLQDVSKSVTALSADELEAKNIIDFVGLSAITPGLTVAKNEGYKTVISIRGVGDETNQNAIAAPSVALHMDGIFVASKFALRTDFIDIERVEVLRGPQGTCLLYTSPSPRDSFRSRMPSSA